MKRIICSMLCIGLVLTGQIFAYAQTEEATPYLYEEYKDVLNAFDVSIPAEETENPLGTVSRAQFASGMIKLLGFDEAEASSAAKADYDDVKRDNEFIKSINLITSLNIMTGSDNKFLPDRPVTYNEAICAAVRALGFGELAEKNGGYPSGYLKFASQLKIITGVKSTSDNYMSYDAVMRLFFNMLEAPICETAGIAGDFTVYEKSEENTLMSAYLDTVKVKGVITANEFSAIKSESKASEGCVRINGEDFFTGISDAENYIGIQSVAYARQVNDTDDFRTIIYISKKSGSDVLTVKIKDIENVKGFNSEDGAADKKTPVITYNKTQTLQKSIKLKPSADISYNGLITDDIQNEDFTDGNGEITFSDTDNSGDYDFVSITNYKNYMISGVNLEKKEVYLKNSGVVLELDGEKRDVNIYKYSKKVSVDNLAKDDVISIAVPKGESSDINSYDTVTVMASSEVIVQKVSEINGTEQKVLLNGKWYDASTDAFSDIIINTQQRFFIDAFGCVYSVENIAIEDTKYGYFLGFAKEKKLSPNVQVKFYVLDEKEVRVFNLAEKVRFTGYDENGDWINSKIFKEDKMYDVFSTQFNTQQLVKYSLDSQNCVSVFLQAKDKENEAGYGGYSSEEFTLEETAEKAELVIQNNMLTQTYRMDSGTVALIVPETGNVEDIDVGNGDTVAGVTGSLNSVMIYDSTDSLHAGVVVAKTKDAVGELTATDDFAESPLLVIEKVRWAINEQGEETYKVSGWYGGTYREFFAKDTEVINKWKTNWDEYNSKRKLSELSLGDAVIAELNTKGEITGVMILFSFDGKNLPETSFYVEHNPNQSFGTVLNTSFGTVTKNTENKTLRLSSSDKRIFAIKGNVYLCELGRKTIRLAEGEIIMDSDYTMPDTALIRARKNEVYDIVIYRK